MSTATKISKDVSLVIEIIDLLRDYNMFMQNTAASLGYRTESVPLQTCTRAVKGKNAYEWDNVCVCVCVCVCAIAIIINQVYCLSNL